MIQTIHIINGPNLNLIGLREPEIYGHVGFDEYIIHLRNQYPACRITYFQSNHEGELIDKLQAVGFEQTTGIILNAGGYSHTSIALADAVRAIVCPLVEVHISDIETREPYRQHSYIRSAAEHFIAGQGMKGYDQAIDFLIDLRT